MKKKLKMILGEELAGTTHTVTISAAASASDTATVNTVTSVLTYTRSSTNRYYVTNTVTTRQSGGLKYIQSVAVQNFAVESNSSSVTYGYNKVDLATGKKTPMSGEYTEASTNYDSLGGSSGGSGVAYTFNMPKNSSAYVCENVSYFLDCHASNSSVTTGGKFNIYGNMALVTGGISFSVSFPWGISIGSGNLNVTHCKTQLTATLNA